MVSYTLVFVLVFSKFKKIIPYHLLEAVAKLIPVFPQLRLVAAGVGDKEYQKKLYSHSEQLGIADGVYFSGYQ